MRKSKVETARTREHIVTTAATEFRRKGVEGIGLSDLMAKAGLTHGGFYRHFKTKDDLVSEALGHAFVSSIQRLEDTKEEVGADKLISGYLSEAHRDNLSRGCPYAALGGELVRCDRKVRDKATTAFLKQTQIIARKLKGLSPSEAQKRALVIMSSIAGALTMARVVTDLALSRAILKETATSLISYASEKK